MRSSWLPVLAFLALSSAAEEAASPLPDVPAHMTIPAQLSKTIRTDKTHVGDKVEFKTVEPVLIGKGVIMPIDTKLHGRVLGAASRQADKPSWLVVLVDNAEWKNHSLPLNVLIVSLINGNDQPSASRHPRPRSAHQLPPWRPGPLHDPSAECAIGLARPSLLHQHCGTGQLAAIDRQLEDVKVFRAQNGLIFLLSKKENLKLPGGLFFMRSSNRELRPCAVSATSQ